MSFHKTRSEPNVNYYTEKSWSYPKKNRCNNCKKVGHNIKNCLKPITSYGIICYKREPRNLNKIRYVLIHRKHSINFVEFMKLSFHPKQFNFIQNMISYMTKGEQEMMLTKSFDELIDYVGMGSKRESNRQKFNDIINGNVVYENYIEHPILEYKDGKKILKLDSLIKKFPSKYDEPELTFPKGRAKPNEHPKEVAVREFTEETGILEDQMVFLNVPPIIELYEGSNGKYFQSVFFIAEYKDKNNNELVINDYMEKQGEVGDIGWYTYEEAISGMRDYHIERKDVLTWVNNYLIIHKPNF